MADMLVELIQKFIDGSEATLNSLFKSMVNLVFFIERELNAIQSNGGGKIDFNGIYQVVFNYACFLLVIVFIGKLIRTYFMHSEGDAEKSPIMIIIGMMKAVIIMICFKEIYDIFVGVISNFLDSILGEMPVKMVSLSATLSNNISGGIFTAVACLILLITWIILICQFIMKGIEMLIMRIGIPFASIGLLNSDGGVFYEYVRGFFMTALTLVVQLSLMNLSILVIANGHIIYSIAIAVISVNTPMILGKYLIKPNGSIINSVGNTARNIRAIFPSVRKR